MSTIKLRNKIGKVMEGVESVKELYSPSICIGSSKSSYAASITVWTDTEASGRFDYKGHDKYDRATERCILIINETIKVLGIETTDMPIENWERERYPSVRLRKKAMLDGYQLTFKVQVGGPYGMATVFVKKQNIGEDFNEN